VDREASLQAVGRALCNPGAVDLVQQVVRAGYHENFKGELDRADRLVDRAFTALVKSQALGIDPAALVGVSADLTANFFHQGVSEFWFNRLYHTYKTVTKPDADFQQLRNLIQGRRVLDYGCGSGYLGARLARGGYEVVTTDVLDYRYEEARNLPFVRMTSPTDLDYPRDSIDTALVQAVLHHIDPPNLPEALRGLGRVATHLLIKEDTYNLSPDLPRLDETVAQQPLLEAFVRLSSEAQFEALILIDYYANAVAQGIPEMNMPFAFKSPGAWEQTLEDNGWRVSRIVLGGFEPGRMHKSCHIWLLCARNAGA
jgi:SAM-dependent methyltransferase